MYFWVVEGEDLFVLVVGVEDVYFFPVVWGFVPVACFVVFLLVAGLLVAGVGGAEVFVFLVWGSLFSVVFLPLLLRFPAVSPPF